MVKKLETHYFVMSLYNIYFENIIKKLVPEYIEWTKSWVTKVGDSVIKLLWLLYLFHPFYST